MTSYQLGVTVGPPLSGHVRTVAHLDKGFGRILETQFLLLRVGATAASSNIEVSEDGIQIQFSFQI